MSYAIFYNKKILETLSVNWTCHFIDTLNSRIRYTLLLVLLYYLPMKVDKIPALKYFKLFSNRHRRLFV